MRRYFLILGAGGLRVTPNVLGECDVHAIDVIVVEGKDDEIYPLGVQGIGEIGIVGTAAAIANAVYHATGKRVRDLPMTLDKLMRLNSALILRHLRWPRCEELAGAPGLEPGNGGIKIQVIRLICQSVFRKSAKIRPQSNQEVSGHFGMRNAYRIACHAAPRADNAEMKLMLADGDLREHFEAFLNAYNFAERLKALNGLRPYAHICKVWADQPSRFSYDLLHLTSGQNKPLVSN